MKSLEEKIKSRLLSSAEITNSLLKVLNSLDSTMEMGSISLDFSDSKADNYKEIDFDVYSDLYNQLLDVMEPLDESLSQEILDEKKVLADLVGEFNRDCADLGIKYTGETNFNVLRENRRKQGPKKRFVDDEDYSSSLKELRSEFEKFLLVKLSFDDRIEKFEKLQKDLQKGFSQIDIVDNVLDVLDQINKKEYFKSDDEINKTLHGLIDTDINIGSAVKFIFEKPEEKPCAGKIVKSITPKKTKPEVPIRDLYKENEAFLIENGFSNTKAKKLAPRNVEIAYLMDKVNLIVESNGLEKGFFKPLFMNPELLAMDKKQTDVYVSAINDLFGYYGEHLPESLTPCHAQEKYLCAESIKSMIPKKKFYVGVENMDLIIDPVEKEKFQKKVQLDPLNIGRPIRGTGSSDGKLYDACCKVAGGDGSFRKVKTVDFGRIIIDISHLNSDNCVSVLKYFPTHKQYMDFFKKK